MLLVLGYRAKTHSHCYLESLNEAVGGGGGVLLEKCGEGLNRSRCADGRMTSVMQRCAPGHHHVSERMEKHRPQGFCHGTSTLEKLAHLITMIHGLLLGAAGNEQQQSLLPRRCSLWKLVLVKAVDVGLC